jgi:hypothetical protein
MMAATTATQAQSRLFTLEKDSIPLFRGFSLSFDLVGPAMLMLGDHGEYEGALRMNLHDQWFPVFELGVGRANREHDEVTYITYKTTAPYFRIGMDWNILRNKHQPNRLYAGFRYAFTNYKVDITRDMQPDPVWGTLAGFSAEGISCSQHWMEAVMGIDAKVFGPLHLGWTVRYKRKLSHSDFPLGQPWYVPGFGIYDNDQLSANFNVIIDI